MDRILTGNIWKKISVTANKAKQRQAALAYVTSRDYVRFRAGDILICDASPGKIRSGETDAATLKAFFDAGAELYCYKRLHAKTLVYGSNVLVGSCNLSTSSAETLREAALLSTRTSIRLETEKFIAQTKRISEPIDRKFINRILKIEVTEKTFGTTGKKKQAVDHQSPTLLQALERKAPVVNDFVYSWFHEQAALPIAVVNREVGKQDALPPSLQKGDWNWFEWKDRAGLKEKLDKAFSGRQCINLSVQVNDNDEIQKFRYLQSTARSYLRTIRITHRNEAHRLVLDLIQKKTPGLTLRGRLWPTELCQILTAGIKADRRLGKVLSNRITCTITGKELLRLYSAGVNSIKLRNK